MALRASAAGRIEPGDAEGKARRQLCYQEFEVEGRGEREIEDDDDKMAAKK